MLAVALQQQKEYGASKPIRKADITELSKLVPVTMDAICTPTKTFRGEIKYGNDGRTAIFMAKIISHGESTALDADYSVVYEICIGDRITDSGVRVYRGKITAVDWQLVNGQISILVK